MEASPAGAGPGLDGLGPTTPDLGNLDSVSLPSFGQLLDSIDLDVEESMPYDTLRSVSPGPLASSERSNMLGAFVSSFQRGLDPFAPSTCQHPLNDIPAGDIVLPLLDDACALLGSPLCGTLCPLPLPPTAAFIPCTETNLKAMHKAKDKMTTKPKAKPAFSSSSSIQDGASPAAAHSNAGSGIASAPANGGEEADSLFRRRSSVGGDKDDPRLNSQYLQDNGYFDMPIKDAAASLGIGQTKLKRTCRQLGIGRWPFRARSSIRCMLESLSKHAEAVGLTQEELEGRAEAALEDLRKNPSKSVDTELKRLRQSLFKQRHKRKECVKRD